MHNLNKLFAKFTLLALVANASARPVDLLAGQDPSMVTHSLNSTHTESAVPVTSTVIVDSSLSVPSVPTLTDHKDIPTSSAPVLPATPSGVTATPTTLPTGTPAVPSTPVDTRASIIPSYVVPSAAPHDVHCLGDCHLIAHEPSPDDVPEHTMTTGSVLNPAPTPTNTISVLAAADSPATESLPSASGNRASALPTTILSTDLGAQTPAVSVAETSASPAIQASVLSTTSTTTLLLTSTSVPSVSAGPPAAPSPSVSISSMPASVPSAPATPGAPSSTVIAVPTLSTPFPPVGPFTTPSS
ncbi:hypothetical protein C8Q80DRAFT_1273255 [Daedaleopsis nitida]|nr:hypothetical protein C8Q80DRAFT_1273255 [Daedaleopsis nitida]